MKRNISKIFFCGIALAAFTLVSCGDDADYGVLHDQAFIAQTNTNGNSSQKLTVGNDPVSTALTVRLSDATSEACQFELEIDEAVLQKYNERNSESLNLLPAEGYELSSNVITIEAGNANSLPITLTVFPFSEEISNTGLKYAIPFRLKSKDGKKTVLSSGSEFVIVLDKVPIQAVPLVNSNCKIDINFGEEQPLLEYTVEMCVNMDILGTRVGQYNNQGLFWRGTTNGSGECYLRFGDAPIEGNRFQTKTMGTQMNSNMLFTANQWYHLAVVCTGTKLYFYFDGALDNSMDLPGTVQTFASTAQLISSGTYWKANNAKIAQFRFWSKARTQAEIANSMYSVDPNSEGLECYLKMDDGSGDTFHDYSGHGRDGVSQSTIRWQEEVRIDGK